MDNSSHWDMVVRIIPAWENGGKDRATGARGQRVTMLWILRNEEAVEQYLDLLALLLDGSVSQVCVVGRAGRIGKSYVSVFHLDYSRTAPSSSHEV